MKKRIISISLAIVMVVGMAVSMLTASAYSFIDEESFDAYVSANALKVDAQMDDAYKMSEQVSNAYTNYTSGSGSGFDSWTVATKEGLYVYTVIDDTTVGSEHLIYCDNRGSVNTVSNADKVQVYFKFDFTNTNSWWCYFEMDYYANNVDGETMVDNEITAAWNKTYNHVRYKQGNLSGTGISSIDTNTIPAGIDYASKILRDSTGAEYGWVSEFFIPFDVAGCVPEDQTTLPATGIGVQVNNDDWSIDEGKTAFGDGWKSRKGYAYSRYVGGSSWWNIDFTKYPLTPLNFSEESFYDFDVYLTSDHVELDGKLDDVYLNSSRIDVAEQWSGNLGEHEVPFYAYVVAGLDGMYVFADVKDTTMNNINNTDPANGEMVQIYLDWSPLGTAHTDPGVTFDTSATRGYNKVYGSWMGWFQADYDGNLSGSFDTDTRWLKDYGAKVAVQKHANPVWNGIEGSQNQYVGYSLEFFVPYNDYMQYIVDTQNFADYHFSFGLQVNDDETYDGTENRTSIGYTERGGNYWAHFEYLPEMRLVPDANLPRHAAGTTVSSVTLDGANTNGEYDKAQVIHVNLAGSGAADDGDIYRVICDGNYVYILAEVVDTTPTYDSTYKSLGYAYRDYCDIYIARYESSDTVLKGSYAAIHRESNSTDIKVVDNGADGWTAERRYALTAAEKAAFQKGELVIGFAAQYLDGTATASGRIYKYDNEQGGVFYGGGGNTYAPGYHKFVFGANTVELPKIDGANVSLGEKIAINYYATLGIEDTDAKLKVTMNDKVTYVGAKATDVKNQYKFTFDGIAPQTMGDNVSAELIVDGKVVDTKATYSVLDNVTKLVADDEDLFENTELEQLVYELLNYGAAAQVYADYKTDALVNAGYEDGSVAKWDPVAENGDRTFTGALADGRFTAVGIYHSGANKIYAKFNVEDAANATVKVNGKPVIFDKYEYDGRVYIAYSEDIKVIDFDKVYTFELTTAEGTQTLTYSVNAYAYAKCEAEDTATAGLAKALYFYGIAAKDYAAN